MSSGGGTFPSSHTQYNTPASLFGTSVSSSWITYVKCQLKTLMWINKDKRWIEGLTAQSNFKIKQYCEMFCFFMITVKSRIVNTPEIWTPPNENTTSWSHLYILHYKKLWTPPNVKALLWFKGVHITEVSLYYFGVRGFIQQTVNLNLCGKNQKTFI